MTRLVAFGCSFTYGEGLPDCYASVGEVAPNPSKFAWPNLVAKELSLECANYSFPGRCNKHILLDILNADLKSDDIVMCLWTSTQRGVIFAEYQKPEYFLPSQEDSPLKKHYYSLHTNHDLFMQTMLDIHHANMFLSNKNIKVYNFFTDRLISNKLMSNEIDYNFNLKLKLINVFNMQVDYALDGRHPGLKSQENISKSILKYISL